MPTSVIRIPEELKEWLEAQAKAQAEATGKKVTVTDILNDLLRNEILRKVKDGDNFLKPSSEANRNQLEKPEPREDYAYDYWQCPCDAGVKLRNKEKVHCNAKPMKEKPNGKRSGFWHGGKDVPTEVCENCYNNLEYGFMGSFLSWRKTHPYEPRDIPEEESIDKGKYGLAYAYTADPHKRDLIKRAIDRGSPNPLWDVWMEEGKQAWEEMKNLSPEERLELIRKADQIIMDHRFPLFPLNDRTRAKYSVTTQYKSRYGDVK